MSSKLVRSTNDGSVGPTVIDALYSYAVLLTGIDAKVVSAKVLLHQKME
jgi:hypothetical protein